MNGNSKIPRVEVAVMSLIWILTISYQSCAQGSLEPPGPPEPTMKTLQQIEPRTPISVLPFVISQPGSYYLTTNLLGVAGQNGVTIGASGVTIDLMGFELVGAPGSFDKGIVDSGSRTNITIRNGTIHNWGSTGVDISANSFNVAMDNLLLSHNQDGLRGGTGSRIQNCSAISNRFFGIFAAEGSRVIDCVTQRNVGGGIHVFAGSEVSGCTARLNGSYGIFASTGSSVLNCTANSNNGDGIRTFINCKVSGCSASFNTEDGIDTGAGSMVSGCAAQSNTVFGVRVSSNSQVDGCLAINNGGHGIFTGASCVVRDNNCTGNGFVTDGAGISLGGAGNRVDNNNVVFNATGIRAGTTGNLIIRNNAHGNGNPISSRKNYVFVFSGQTFGNTNSLTGQIPVGTSSDPWRNFSF